MAEVLDNFDGDSRLEELATNQQQLTKLERSQTTGRFTEEHRANLGVAFFFSGNLRNVNPITLSSKKSQ
jgi:hypothetical protein